MDKPPVLDDPRAGAVLALLAQQAHIDRSRLPPDVRADELGLSRLELELALFEIEDRFDIDLPSPPGGDTAWTVGELVQQVLQCCDTQRRSIGGNYSSCISAAAG